MIVFDFSVNAAYSIRLRACDDKGINKIAPTTREEVDLEESESRYFLLISYFVCVFLHVYIFLFVLCDSI
jgi:hypothetical protein